MPAPQLRRIGLFAALGLLGLPLLLFAFLRLGGATPLVNLALKRELGALFNGELRFGSVKTDIFSFAEIDDLLVLTRQGEARIPVLTAARIRLNYDGWQLIRGRRDLEDAVELLSIKGMRVFLLRDKKGGWNLREVLKLPGGAERKKKKAAAGPKTRLPTLATRLVLEDSVIVFNDERRGFQSTVDNVEGTLDARAFPLVAFSLSGRTEDKKKDDLSIAGEWNAEEASLIARADLELVPLKTYLNYALPAGGLQFLGGDASLSVRVKEASAQSELEFSGRARVHQGSLFIPGITDPLDKFEGELLFGEDRLKVSQVHADFLGSTWKVEGELRGLRSPELNLVLENSSVALSPLSQQIHGLRALSLSGTASLSLTMTGKAVNPAVSGALSAPEMELAGIHFTAVDAAISMNRRGLEVSSLKGRLWNGGVLAHAQIVFPNKISGPQHGSIDAALKGQGVDLGLVRYKGVEYLPITGTASIQAEVKGELNRPRVEASLSCPAAYFSGHPMGSLRLDSAVEGRTLALKLDTWHGALKADVGFDFEKRAEFSESTVRLRDFPLDELMRAIAGSHDTALISPALRAKMTLNAQSYSGKADVEMGLSGPLNTPDLSLRILKHTGRLRLAHGLWKSRDPEGLAFNALGLLRLGADGLKLGEGKQPFIVSLAGGRTFELRLLGRLPVKASQAEDKDGLNLQLSADLGALDALENFEKTKGSASMDLRLLGRIDSLRADGWLQLKDFASNMARYFPRLKNGEAEVWVSDKLVTVENLSFESGGQLQASGRLDFSGGSRPTGVLEARTDIEDGLNLGDFDYGNLKVILDPLRLQFRGSEGVLIAGRAKMHDSVLTLAKPSDLDPETGTAVAAREPYPVEFDLRAGLDENVWLNKIQSGVEFTLDPFVVLKQTLNSAIETLQNPGFEFLFKPTEADFYIRGRPPLLQISGELGIDRGTLTFMENEFKIQQESRANRIIFRGFERLRADIDASAVAQIRYVHELPGGRLEPKTVRVTVNIKPFTEDELVEAHLENSLLNYHLAEFKSDPPLSLSAAEDRAAILSLLVLGDPLNQATRDAIGNAPSSSQGASVMQLASIQAGRMISGVLRKTINRYAKFIGNQVVDYVRLAPRLRYQGASASAASKAVEGTPGGTAAVSKQVQQEGVSVSWLFELGRNLGKNFFASAQIIAMGEDDVAAARSQSTGPVTTEVRPWGARLGAEYRFNSTRIAELSYGYSADENLEPVAFDPSNLTTAHQVYLGLRNTVPTDNYTPRLAHERHLAALEDKEHAE